MTMFRRKHNQDVQLALHRWAPSRSLLCHARDSEPNTSSLGKGHVAANGTVAGALILGRKKCRPADAQAQHICVQRRPYRFSPRLHRRVVANTQRRRSLDRRLRWPSTILSRTDVFGTETGRRQRASTPSRGPCGAGRGLLLGFLSKSLGKPCPTVIRALRFVT
jgi:hypothetical protein